MLGAARTRLWGVRPPLPRISRTTLLDPHVLPLQARIAAPGPHVAGRTLLSDPGPGPISRPLLRFACPPLC